MLEREGTPRRKRRSDTGRQRRQRRRAGESWNGDVEGWKEEGAGKPKIPEEETQLERAEADVQGTEKRERERRMCASPRRDTVAGTPKEGGGEGERRGWISGV